MFRVSILLLSVFTCSVVGVISAGVVGYRANQQEKKVVANSDQAKSENAKATQATSKTKQQEKGDLKSKKDNQKASESKKEDSKNGKSAKGKKQDDSNDHPDKAPNSKSGADAGWLDSDAQKATRKSLEWLSRSHFQSVHSNTKALENCQLCHQAESVSGAQQLALLGLGMFDATNANKSKLDDKAQSAPFLGVHALDLSPALRSHLRLDNNQGAIVSHVIEESPAYHCGLQQHDILLLLDDQEVQGQESLKNLVRSRSPGTKVKLQFLRYGKRQSLDLVLGRHRLNHQVDAWWLKGCSAAITPSTACQNCHASQ